MDTMHSRFVILYRLVIGAALVGLLLGQTALATRAESRDETAYNNSVFQIAMCELAGGHAEVTTYMTAAGAYVVTVTCRGGLLDGMTCQNGFPGDPDNCWWAWRIQPGGADLPKITEAIEPLDEPSVPGPGDVDDGRPADGVVTEPVVVEPTATPMPDVTATPEDGVNVDPVVDDGSVDVVPIDPPKDEPATGDDGGGSGESGERPVVPEIPIDPGDILPIEPEEPVLL
jgi:hypothetical protein